MKWSLLRFIYLRPLVSDRNIVDLSGGATQTVRVVLDGAVGSLVPERVEAGFEEEFKILSEDTSCVVECSRNLVLNKTLIGFTWLRYIGQLIQRMRG